MDETSDSDEEIFCVKPKIMEVHKNYEGKLQSYKIGNISNNMNKRNIEDKNTITNTVCKPVTVSLIRLSDTQIKTIIQRNKSKLNRITSCQTPSRINRIVQHGRVSRYSIRQSKQKESINEKEYHQCIQTEKKENINIGETICPEQKSRRSKENYISEKETHRKNIVLGKMQQRVLQSKEDMGVKDLNESEDADMKEAFKRITLNKWELRRKRDINSESESSDSVSAEENQPAIKRVKTLTTRESDQSVKLTPQNVNKLPLELRIILTRLEDEKINHISIAKWREKKRLSRTAEVLVNQSQEGAANHDSQRYDKTDTYSMTADDNSIISTSPSNYDNMRILNQAESVVYEIRSSSQPTKMLIRKHKISYNPKVVLLRLESLMIPTRERYSASEVERIVEKYVDFLMNSNFASGPRNPDLLGVRRKVFNSVPDDSQTDVDKPDEEPVLLKENDWIINEDDSTSVEQQKFSSTASSVEKQTSPVNSQQDLLSVWKKAFCTNKKQKLLEERRETKDSKCDASQEIGDVENNRKNGDSNTMRVWSNNFKRWLPTKSQARPINITRPLPPVLNTERTVATVDKNVSAIVDKSPGPILDGRKVENNTVTTEQLEQRNQADNERKSNCESIQEPNMNNNLIVKIGIQEPNLVFKKSEDLQISTSSNKTAAERASPKNILEKETMQHDLPRQENHNLPIKTSITHRSLVQQIQEVPCEPTLSVTSTDFSVQQEKEIAEVQTSSHQRQSCVSTELNLPLEQSNEKSPIKSFIEDSVQEASAEQNDKDGSCPTQTLNTTCFTSCSKEVSEQSLTVTATVEVPENTTCTSPNHSITANESQENSSLPSGLRKNVGIMEEPQATPSLPPSPAGNLVIDEEIATISSSTSCIDETEESMSITTSTKETVASETKDVQKKTLNNNQWWLQHFIRQCNQLNSFQCHVCLSDFESKEDLATHLYRHTSQELQEAYENAKTKSLNEKEKRQKNNEKLNTNPEIETAVNNQMFEAGIRKKKKKEKKRVGEKVDAGKETKRSKKKKAGGNKKKTLSENDESTKDFPISPGNCVTILPRDSSASVLSSPNSPRVVKSITICRCHKNEMVPSGDDTLRMEMVLLCRLCQVLFRSMECFETHYRTEPLCNQDRSYGRSPKIFCSGCRVILNSLQDMRHHLEMHLKRNRQSTMSVICNICKVFFFGVGVLFHTHWLHHVKNPFFVASRLSFPRTSVIQYNTNSKMISLIDPFIKSSIGNYLLVAEYICRDCRTPFCTERDLRHHVRTECIEARRYYQLMLETDLKVDAPKPRPKILEMICGDCDEIFHDRLAYEQHAYRHNEAHQVQPQYITVSVTAVKSAFICQVCANVFETLKELGDHWSRHVDVRRDFICTRCNARFSSFDEFIKHAKNDCVRKMLSPSCKVSYHRPEYNCMVCHLVFENQQSLNEHLVLHGENVKCSRKESLVIAKLMENAASASTKAGVTATQQNQSGDSAKIIPYSSVPEIILLEGSPSEEECQKDNEEKAQKTDENDTMKAKQATKETKEPKEVSGGKEDSSSSKDILSDMALPSEIQTLNAEDQSRITPETVIIEEPNVSITAATTTNTTTIITTDITLTAITTNVVLKDQDGSNIGQFHTNDCQVNDQNEFGMTNKNTGNVINPEPKRGFLRVRSLSELREKKEHHKCDVCDLIFDSLTKHNRHVAMHSARFKSVNPQQQIFPENHVMEAPITNSADIAMPYRPGLSQSLILVDPSMLDNDQVTKNNKGNINRQMNSEDQCPRIVNENVANPNRVVVSNNDGTTASQFLTGNGPTMYTPGTTNLQKNSQESSSNANVRIKKNYKIRCKFCPSFRCNNTKEFNVHEFTTGHINRKRFYKQQYSNENLTTMNTNVPATNIVAPATNAGINVTEPTREIQTNVVHPQIQQETNANNSQLHLVQLNDVSQLRNLNDDLQGLVDEWSTQGPLGKRRTGSVQGQVPQVQVIQNASSAYTIHHVIPSDPTPNLSYCNQHLVGTGNPSNVIINPTSNNKLNPLFMELPVSNESSTQQQIGRWQAGPDDNAAFTCLYCTTPVHFANADLLYQHIARDHNYLCEICGYRVYTSNDLDIHKSMHGNIWTKPFPY